MEGIVSTYDIVDGVFIRKDHQDVQEIIDSNDKERNSGENENRFANARKVATIPLVVLESLKNRPMSEGGPIDINLVGADPDHTFRFARWLDDSANRKFRTSEARIGNGHRFL